VLFNGIGFAGHSLICLVGYRYGLLNAAAPTVLAASIILYFWMAVYNADGLFVWSSFYGVAAAVVQSLSLTNIALFTNDRNISHARTSMAFIIVSLAALTGPPIADTIIELERGYMGAQIFAGSVTLLGFACLAAAKMMWMNRTKAGWLEKI
jgi:hypothetical protein